MAWLFWLLLYPFQKPRRGLVRMRLQRRMKNEVAEEFLELLLRLMSLTFLLNRKLRAYIEGFNGLIQFRSKDNKVRVLAEFKKGRLKVRELKPEDTLEATPNAEIVFKNAGAVMNFLLPKGGLEGRRDVLRSLLNNEVTLVGNYNYIYRFGFLATHLQLQLKNVFG